MTDVETAVDRFLEQSTNALEEYDQGYADADATVRVLRARIDELQAALE